MPTRKTPKAPVKSANPSQPLVVKPCAVSSPGEVCPPRFPAAPQLLPTPHRSPATVPQVLLAHSDPALLHLARESLETFLHCQVRTTTSGLAAFDRTLQGTYQCLLLDLHLLDLPGELLYDLISRTYPKVHPGTLTAPPVVWLGLPADQLRHDALTREARTKALLMVPLNIQRLLHTAATLLPEKSIAPLPTAG